MWLAVALILLLVFCGTNLIVGILWHESYGSASQPASQPAQRKNEHEVCHTDASVQTT